MFRRALSVALATALVALAPNAGAQNMDALDFELQPLQYMRQGEVDACGARLFGAIPWGGTNQGRGVDISVNLRREGALVKALTYDIALSTGAKPTIRSVPIETAWIRAQGKKAARPIDGKPKSGETPDSIIFLVDMEAAADALIAVLDRRQIQVGIKRKAESGERIFYGVAKAAEGDMQQLAMCMKELLK